VIVIDFMPERKAHPLNAEGPFYVENGCCLACDLPRQVAPDMFKYNETEGHCYVYKQPETQEQLCRMIEVVQCAELACVRCRSRDEHLLRRLKEKGLESECDYPATCRQ
jgi:hypothetical protein